MPRPLLAVCCVAALAGAGCGSGPQAAEPTAVAQAQARQAERLRRVDARHAQRDRVLASVAAQRDEALAELRRIDRVRGRSSEGITGARYGSDGTGDPEPWVQEGPGATKAPTSTPATIAQFSAAQAEGRITLVGAARQHEVRDGLIDDRVLQLLIVLSGERRLEVNSFRVSHPKQVQDDLGTPTASNHVYGRAADVSAVDGVPCERETRGSPYRTLLDNPPPQRPGPCLSLAHAAAAVGGALAPGEIIYYWRVPGAAGVSMPNHDDHVHLGFRSYGPAQPVSAEPDTGADLQLPAPGPPKTIGEDRR